MKKKDIIAESNYFGMPRKKLTKLIYLLGYWCTLKYLVARKTGIQSIRVRPRGSKYTFHIRIGQSDVKTAWQVYAHNEFDLELPFTPKTILDGGANIGCASLALHQKYPSATIVGVEPDHKNYLELVRNTKVIKGYHAIEKGLWSAPGHIRCTTPTKLGWGLQFEAASEPGHDTVPCTTIHALADEFNIDQFDLVKLDVEGAEAAIFKDKQADWLKNAKVVLIETHGDSGDIVEPALIENGFKLSMMGEKILAIKE